MSSVSMKNICKKYPNGFEAVKDFNLEIADQEFIIFVGPSGCGKSTTLRMVAGLEDISSGDLVIDGKRVNDVEPKDRDIAMVFQNYALYPHMTVYDNIAFGLKMRKVPKDEIDKKVKEAAKILDLEQLLDRKPKALSGGQRQRVAMGRAIVRNPKVFLMDGTRIVVLKDGVVQQVDSPQKLYNQPNNLFVAGFIGSPQMNFVNATCKVSGSDVTLNFDKFSIALPPAKAKKLVDGGYNGKTVIMGIRPEDLGDSDYEMSNYAAKIDSNVTGYELLGSEVILYFQVGGANMSAKVESSTTARLGDHVTLALNPEKIHVFDHDTELTITN